MYNIHYNTKIKTVAEVEAELDHRNRCVDAWLDAFEWLKEATKDKLDKKATKAILTKWQTEYTSGHMEEKDLGNGLGWQIHMGQSPYKSECNMIYVNACDVDYYSNGNKFLRPVKDFYTGQFEYPKGATWREVLEAITKYTLPQKVTYTMDDLEDFHDNLVAIVEGLQDMNNADYTYYKDNGWYPVNKFIREN